MIYSQNGFKCALLLTIHYSFVYSLSEQKGRE
jgi:hypothetical protein